MITSESGRGTDVISNSGWEYEAHHPRGGACAGNSHKVSTQKLLVFFTSRHCCRHSVVFNIIILVVWMTLAMATLLIMTVIISRNDDCCHDYCCHDGCRRDNVGMMTVVMVRDALE